MPTVEFNKRVWDGEYDWNNHRGDAWSAPWGGPHMQWYGSILPRIKSRIPTGRILEIACGYGRWTHYLKDMCESLVVIDLSKECIQACRERFSDCSHIEYHVNDGKSLDMIPDSSVDFVFSFDSLVHADESVLKAYIHELKRILTHNGSAFLHHSNLGGYHLWSRILSKQKVERLLKRFGIPEKDLLNRDLTVSAQKVAAFSEDVGLKCINQETIRWKTKRMFIDCFSTIVRKDTSRVRSYRLLENKKFMTEADNLLQLSKLYSPEIPS
jgi:ubiquinone/menaquinone biosynthesis C-methylase UbiE